MRVFKDIIISNVIQPQFKKKELEELDYLTIRDIAQYVINKSLSDICKKQTEDFTINNKLKKYENDIFNLSPEANILLDNNIHYADASELINKNMANNLKWLKLLSKEKDFRKELSLHFPVEKVVIAEGITEETLLLVFAKHLDYDFDKYGVQMISAGGKNQVVKLFYKLAEQLKIPVLILLDADAYDNKMQILPKLRTCDKIHIIEHGEFEDILPKSLILNTLNDLFLNFNSVNKNEFTEDRMVKNLEEIFKQKGMHDFQKAEFAKSVSKHIFSKNDISQEIEYIINEIKSL